MNEADTYAFHQTPVALAQALIPRIPLEPNDTLYEAFKGEGAFYDNFPRRTLKGLERDYTGEGLQGLLGRVRLGHYQPAVQVGDGEGQGQ